MFKNIFLGLSLCLISLLSACGEEKINLPGTPLDYFTINEEFINSKDAKGYFRETYYVEIFCINLLDNATQADLISTAMQAALDYHKKISTPIINVRFMATGEPNLFTPTLAFISYVPDKKGINGYTDNSPVWLNAKACARGFTQNEMEYIYLYEKLAPNYLDTQTMKISKEKNTLLKAEIEKQLNIKFEIDPMENVLQNVPLSN